MGGTAEDKSRDNSRHKLPNHEDRPKLFKETLPSPKLL